MTTPLCRLCGTDLPTAEAEGRTWVLPDVCSKCSAEKLAAAGMLGDGALIVPRRLFIHMMNAVSCAEAFCVGDLPKEYGGKVVSDLRNVIASYGWCAKRGIVPSVEEMASELSAEGAQAPPEQPPKTTPT